MLFHILNLYRCLERQLTAERTTLDQRRAELDVEYEKCVATKDALRAEGERAAGLYKLIFR